MDDNLLSRSFQQKGLGGIPLGLAMIVNCNYLPAMEILAVCMLKLCVTITEYVPGRFIIKWFEVEMSICRFNYGPHRKEKRPFTL